MKRNRFLFLLSLIFIFFTQQSIVAHAQDVSKLSIKVETDKQEYAEKDEINYQLTIANKSNNKAKNVVITSTIPNGLEVTSKDLKVEGKNVIWNVDTIDPSSDVKLGFKVKVKNPEAAATPVQTNVENHSPSSGTTAPQTGDSTSYLGYLFLFIFSSLILFIAIRGLMKKRVPKELSYLLILAMLIPSFSVVRAAEQKEVAENKHTLVINHKEYVVKTTAEALMEVNSNPSNPSKIAVPVTGVATDSENHALKNKKLNFASSQKDVEVVETDEEGYFVARLWQDESYQVTGEGISADISVRGLNKLEVTNNLGKISLGKTLTNGDNIAVLQPGTIVLAEEEVNQIKEVSADMTKVIFDGNSQLKAGDIFYISHLDGYPTGIVLKVVSVTAQDGQTIVVTSEPKLEEAFTTIKGNTSVKVSPADFIPAEGVTINRGAAALSIQANLFPKQLDIQRVSPRSIGFGTTINLGKIEKGPIEFTGSMSIDGEVSGDIDWSWLKGFKSIDFNFQGSQTVKGELSSEVSTDDKISKPLGEYRIPTEVPGLAVSLPVDLVVRYSGKVSIEVESGFKEEVGMEYTPQHGVRVYPEDKFTPDMNVSDLKGSGKIEVGVKLSVLAEFALIDLMGISGEGGLSGEASTSIAGLSGFFQCAEIKTGFYSKLSLEFRPLNWSEPVVENHLDIGDKEFGRCVRSIETNPARLEIAPGQSKILLVKAKDGLTGEDDITGDDNISYKSSDSSIIKVEKLAGKANLIAANNAQDGDTVTVTATFKANGETFKDEVLVKVVDHRERGTLVGKVVDAANGTPIQGASVKLYSGNRAVSNIQTKADGTYESSLVPGTYKIVVSAPDYITDTSNVTVNAANTTTYDSKLQMVGTAYSGIGKASGKITNALTGDGVSGLKLVIRQGRNNLTGDIIKTLTTDAQGNYTVDLPGGNYTVEVSGTGYISTTFNLVSLGGLTKGSQNTTISPDGIIGEGLRVVLNWGDTPKDLDAHFTGPTANGNRFHIYFNNKSFSDSETDANLDVDVVTSYGPETTTVLKRVNQGTYTYAIHNYSDRYASNLNLSNSDATVRLYSGNVLIATYHVPLDKTGNVWRVFEIRDGVVVPINQINYISGWDNASYFAPVGN